MRKIYLISALLICSFRTASAQEAVDAVQQATINQLKADNAKLKSDVSRFEAQMQGLKFTTLYICPRQCASYGLENVVSAAATCRYTDPRWGESTAKCAPVGQVAYK